MRYMVLLVFQFPSFTIIVFVFRGYNRCRVHGLYSTFYNNPLFPLSWDYQTHIFNSHLSSCILHICPYHFNLKILKHNYRDQITKEQTQMNATNEMLSILKLLYASSKFKPLRTYIIYLPTHSCSQRTWNNSTP